MVPVFIIVIIHKAAPNSYNKTNFPSRQNYNYSHNSGKILGLILHRGNKDNCLCAPALCPGALKMR